MWQAILNRKGQHLNDKKLGETFFSKSIEKRILNEPFVQLK